LHNEETAMIFRFDDISANTDMQKTNELAELIRSELKTEIWYCISPLCNSSEKNNGRIYPRYWNALSDCREYYKMDIAEIPQCPRFAKIANHGLVHIDHRLLDYDRQEMSIVISANLTNSCIFVPPFNKWNEDTIKICDSHGYELIKFEDGWRSAEYEPFDGSNDKWYLHPRNFTNESFLKWMLC